jgi:hypothetical protein
MIGVYVVSKCFVHIALDLVIGSRRQIACRRIILDIKFDPDDQVDDLGINSIGPVVVQNLHVIRIGEGWTHWDEFSPLQSIFDDKLEYGAMLLL